MRRITYAAPLAVVLVLAAGAGCASKDDGNPVIISGGGTPTPGASSTTTQSSPKPVTTTSSKPPAPPSWPTPEDCVSYNPNNLTVHYEAGIYQIADGGTVVARIAGGPGENTGDKGLALAQRYTKHCYIGRTNNREDHNDFVFDYWRNPSGATPPIADQEDDCSSYDRNNLTVEDMGGGDGWRVKDHDHVLHLFDNGDDARNGKLVLVKYNQICYLGSGDENFEQVNYGL